MKIKILTLASFTSLLMIMGSLSSCYKNKADISLLPVVSFRNEVVPILTAAGCGCHNNGNVTNAVQFSHLDTVFYSAILSRVATIRDMINDSSKHPGDGAISFTKSQKVVLQNWIAEGAKDDGGGCVVAGTVTYNNNIVPIYTSTCKSSTCHGGVGPNLTYALMQTDKGTITSMMNSGGAIGHPGPVLSLNSCTTKTFLAWIAQGQPQ